MEVLILGSAAGGGYPQWNCRCFPCCRARANEPGCPPRTQSSIAISADGSHWFLFNASPDIRQQIQQMPQLWPQQGIRHSPIQGIAFTDAELDHTVGLLSLREGKHLHIYATSWVHQALQIHLPLLTALGTYGKVDWHEVHLDRPFALLYADGISSNLVCEAFSTTSTKSVAYIPSSPMLDAVVGYRVTERATGHTVVYLPALQAVTESVRNQISNCDCLLIDGTCWQDNELSQHGIANKTSRMMGHLPISGANGTLDLLTTLAVPRKIYIHINNTNPIVCEDSPERYTLTVHGIEVAQDGMIIHV